MNGAPRSEEIVVLGGGIAGLSLAWELCRRGRPPLLIRGTAPAASTVAAGMLAPMPEAGANPRLARLAAESLRAYPGFLADLAGTAPRDPGYAATGVLRVAHGDAAAAALREEVGTYEAAGIPSRWLGRAACLAEVPGLGDEDLIGGLLTYDEAQVQPAWLLEALEAAILAAGGRIEGGDVAALRPSGAQPALRRGVSEAGAGAVVSFAGGRQLEAGRVVLALGAWTARLPDLGYLLRPVRGQLLVFHDVPLPARILYAGHDYLVPKADGSLVLGGTMEEAGFETTPDAGAERLRELLPRLWPAAASAPATARAGLRPAAPDGLPVIGPLPEMPAVYVFSAHFRNGFLLGPHSASLAAGELLGADSHPMLAAFRPGRLRVRD